MEKIIASYNQKCQNYYKKSINLESNCGFKIKISSRAVNPNYLDSIQNIVEHFFIDHFVFKIMSQTTYQNFYNKNFTDMFLEIYEDFIKLKFDSYFDQYNELKSNLFLKFINDNDLESEINNLFEYCQDNYYSKESIYHKKIKLISYNISWEAMEGQNKKRFICKGQEENNECLSNIHRFFNQFIKKEKPDFILLQEASKSDDIFNQINSKFPDFYDICTIKKDLEYSTIIYNKNFKLDSENNFFSGDLEKGRPFMGLFFDGWLCIINVHHDHNNYDKINRIFNSIQLNYPECYRKLKNYDIIIGGDMNHNLEDFNPEIRNVGKFKGITSLNKLNKGKITCCDGQNGLYDNYIHRNKTYFFKDTYDHIIVTNCHRIDSEIYEGALIIDPKYKISDHAPVFSVLYYE